MRIAEPALQAIPRQLSRDDRLCACEMAVVRLSLNNLLTFPWIREAVDAGTLRLQGFRFDIRSGLLTTLVDGRFVQVG